MSAIAMNDIKPNGSSLKVRVQESPDMAKKRSNYWRAVDALKKVAKEDEHFILAPSSFSIHEPTSLELLGRPSVQGYVWDEAVVKKAIPSINMLDLKKSTLGNRRRP